MIEIGFILSKTTQLEKSSYKRKEHVHFFFNLDLFGKRQIVDVQEIGWSAHRIATHVGYMCRW